MSYAQTFSLDSYQGLRTQKKKINKFNISFLVSLYYFPSQFSLTLKKHKVVDAGRSPGSILYQFNSFFFAVILKCVL